MIKLTRTVKRNDTNDTNWFIDGLQVSWQEWSKFIDSHILMDFESHNTATHYVSEWKA